MAEIKKEEYCKLGHHIDGQYKLIIQIFIASLVASYALMGYAVSVIFHLIAVDSTYGNVQVIADNATNMTSTTIAVFRAEPFLALTPIFIFMSCAVLVGYLRKEISKCSTYIQIYLNDGENWKYESKLDIYSRRFREEESSDAIAILYAATYIFCVLLFWWGLRVVSMSEIWLLIIFPLAAVYIAWWGWYSNIPRRCGKIYKERWNQIKDIDDAAKEHKPNIETCGVDGTDIDKLQLESMMILGATKLRKQLRRGCGWNIFLWLVILTIVLSVVVYGTLNLNVWVGISLSCVFAIIAGLYFINSTRYVRDAWETQDKIRNIKHNASELELLRFKLTIQRDYQEVDRNYGIACLTASLITLAITTLIQIMLGK